MEMCKILFPSEQSPGKRSLIISGVDSEKLIFTLAAGATIFVGSLLYGTIRLIEWYNSEPIIPYTIAELDAPKEKKILEKPSIRVRGMTQYQERFVLIMYRPLIRQIFNAMPRLLANSSDISHLQPPGISIE